MDYDIYHKSSKENKKAKESDSEDEGKFFELI